MNELKTLSVKLGIDPTDKSDDDLKKEVINLLGLDEAGLTALLNVDTKDKSAMATVEKQIAKGKAKLQKQLAKQQKKQAKKQAKTTKETNKEPSGDEVGDKSSPEKEPSSSEPPEKEAEPEKQSDEEKDRIKELEELMKSNKITAEQKKELDSLKKGATQKQEVESSEGDTPDEKDLETLTKELNEARESNTVIQKQLDEFKATEPQTLKMTEDFIPPSYDPISSDIEKYLHLTEAKVAEYKRASQSPQRAKIK